MNWSGCAGAFDDLSLVDPDLARFLTEVDFDLDDSLLDDWEDGMEDVGEGGADHGRSSSSRKNTIAQQMRKAGYTVDVLREEDLERIQLIHDRLTNDHIYKERKRPRYKDGIPRIMRNDIRWCYSQMFMNTVNSGDFVKMQNFFHTFMTKPCKFIVDHELDASFSIPHRLLVQGPKLMAHYLLGVFVLFPDLVLTMTDSKIISARGWTGSKITIDFDMKSTKLYDLSLESWVPQVKYLARARKGAASGARVADTLEEGEIPPSEFESVQGSGESASSAGEGAFSAGEADVKSEGEGQCAVSSVADMTGTVSPSPATTTTTDGNQGTSSSSSSRGAVLVGSHAHTVAPVSEKVSASCSSSSSSSADPYAHVNPIFRPTALAVPEGFLPRLFQMGRILDISQGAGADYVTAEDTEIRRKGYRYMSSAKKRTATTSAGETEEAEGEPTAGAVGEKRKLAATADGNAEEEEGACGTEGAEDSAQAEIGQMKHRLHAASAGTLSKTSDLNPDLLIKALFTTAKLQREPQFLHAKGTMTIFLDGNNNMQHINLLLQQVRK